LTQIEWLICPSIWGEITSVHYGRSGSFKIIDIYTNWKLSLVISCTVFELLLHKRRKIAFLPYLTCFDAPYLPNPCEYLHNPHTHTQPFYGSVEYVRDNPGEPVPEETFTQYTHRSHQSSLSAFFIYYDTWHPPYSSLYNPYITRNYIQRTTFPPLTVWVYLHSNFCGGLQRQACNV